MPELGLEDGDEALVDEMPGAGGVEQQQLVGQGQVGHNKAHCGGHVSLLSTNSTLREPNDVLLWCNFYSNVCVR